MASISDKIKNLRELKNFTQDYMAQQLGMTQAGYSKIESGNTDISWSKLTEIANVFNMTVEDMIAFDSQRYFNSFNNVRGNNNGSIIIKVENDELKRLYEDKIIMLEKLFQGVDKELQRYKNKFGEI